MKQKEILYLHLAVMFFGLSGVIARFVEIPAVLIVLGRVSCSTSLLGILLLIGKKRFRLQQWKHYLLLGMTGCVLAVHWTTFFRSIQVSTVAIGTITFSTFPLFVTFLEPLFYKEKLKKENIISAVVLLVGVLITIPEFSMENSMTRGIAWGMVSSFSYAIMTLANRYFSKHYEGMLICFYEQGTAALVLVPVLFFVRVSWHTKDVIGVLVVGFLCTALAYTLFVTAQRKLKAQTVGLISGMEMVYAILYALLFLQEIPSIREIIGGVIILAVALYSTWRT